MRSLAAVLLVLLAGLAPARQREAVEPSAAREGGPRRVASGLVRHPEGGPWTGVDVVYELDDLGGRVRAFRATTGDDGRYRIEVPRPDVVGGERLRAFVDAPGAQAVRVRADSSGPLHLRPPAGATLRVELVDAAGAPAEGAFELVVSNTDPREGTDATTRWRGAGRPRVDVDRRGVAFLHFREPATAYLLARCDAGTAAAFDVRLDPHARGAPGGPVRLVARGAGALRGTLRTPDGTPLPGFPVAAWSEELLADPAAPAGAEAPAVPRPTGPPGRPGTFVAPPRRVALEARGLGRARAETRTDLAGRFELRGLRPGAWRLLAPDSTGTRAHTGDVDVELVERAYRLEVAVAGLDGRDRARSPDVLLLGEAGHGPERPPATTLGAGRWSYPARVGFRYAVRWNDSRRAPTECVARVESGAFTTRVALDLPPPGAPAVLELSARDAETGEALASGAFRELVFELRPEGAAAPWTTAPAGPVELGSGAWTVRALVRPDGRVCGDGSTPPPASTHAPAETRVELIPGERQSLELALEPAAPAGDPASAPR